MANDSIWQKNITFYGRKIMRLDKFLKISRIIKRRSVAKEVADKGRIQINGTLAKSSSSVKVGDTLKIQFGNRILEVKVNELHESTKKEDAAKMYEILSEKRVDNFE
jgi:ribosomal 50S subunit-recycling heat shock protein